MSAAQEPPRPEPLAIEGLISDYQRREADPELEDMLTELRRIESQGKETYHES